MEGDSFPNAALAASGNEPPFALYYDFLFFNQNFMQSSEGAYNTRYPQQPNGITDPSYSISCGIQELKYALEKAVCTGPTDLSKIRLALQAYNFGADSYFAYLEENGQTVWTTQSAQAFAQTFKAGTIGTLAEKTESY